MAGSRCGSIRKPAPCCCATCASLCHAVLCCVAPCCTMLRCAVLCYAVLCCAVPCCAVLCCAVLCCAVLCCAVLCCAVLCCAVMCCAVLCWLTVLTGSARQWLSQVTQPCNLSKRLPSATNSCCRGAFFDTPSAIQNAARRRGWDLNFWPKY